MKIKEFLKARKYAKKSLKNYRLYLKDKIVFGVAQMDCDFCKNYECNYICNNNICPVHDLCREITRHKDVVKKVLRKLKRRFLILW